MLLVLSFPVLQEFVIWQVATSSCLLPSAFGTRITLSCLMTPAPWIRTVRALVLLILLEEGI